MHSKSSNNFWKNQKVLITGHNGFKGTWLSIWLNYKKAKIIGYSLKPKKYHKLYNKSKIEKDIININGDIKDKKKLKNVIIKYRPKIIFHLAAQPIVLDSYDNPRETIDTNFNGTLNLLEICKNFSFIKSIIIVTSDKCYENIKKNNYYSESDKLGGLDPYSCSKSLIELLVKSYSSSFYFKNSKNASLATVRSGNVIGGGDFSNHRIVPDVINSFNSNKTLYLRNPNSIRPWLHILDSLNGYMILAEKLTINDNNFSGSWNFGPNKKNIQTVMNIVNKIKSLWFKKLKNKIIIKKNYNYTESGIIKLNSNKSKKYLNWKPKLDIDQTVIYTIEWYINNNLLNKSYTKCIEQIKNFENIK